ncbi:hypothetical protein QBC43DRAFT_285705 [Cladorrhinum sp. PSN259]|nr:hypothetical protein QBC43DRAFT_285705 [Cladorrhinum sp. PSN259]
MGNGVEGVIPDYSISFEHDWVQGIPLDFQIERLVDSLVANQALYGEIIGDCLPLAIRAPLDSLEQAFYLGLIVEASNRWARENGEQNLWIERITISQPVLPTLHRFRRRGRRATREDIAREQRQRGRYLVVHFTGNQQAALEMGESSQWVGVDVPFAVRFDVVWSFWP